MKQSTLKELILGILTTAALIGVLWFWKGVLPQFLAGILRYQSFFLPFGAAVAAAALFLLTALFVQTPWMAYVFPLGGIAGGILFNEANYTTASVGVIALVLAASAIHRTRQESKLSLGFSISKLSKAGLPLFFTVLSLTISLLYVEHINDKNAVSAFLPKSAFTAILGALASPIHSLTGLPSINPDATVDETLAAVVQEELTKEGIPAGETSRTEMTRLITVERNALAEQYGIRLRGGDKISDVLYQLAADRITDMLGPYTAYLPIVAGIGFFFAFKTLTIPLYYLTLLVVLVLLKIFVASKILTSEHRQITVQKLSL